MSDELINHLSTDLAPVSRLAVTRRLALGLAAGALGSAVLIAATLGFRADMMAAMREEMFWAKLGYGLAIAGVALWACERMARPTGEGKDRAVWLVLPLLAVAALATWQLMRAPPPMRAHMVMGDSAALCPWCVFAVSLPPLAGLMWAVRGLAPTRLRLTGLMLGLTAGGTGAAVYALHCPEPTAPFLAIWYTLGVAASGLTGALAGPRLLRW